MIELDVHPTRDGALAVMHDPHVERTTDGAGHIHDLTLAEVRRLDAAARFGGERSYGPQQVPTLQEVYDLVAGRCRINVEIKQPGQDAELNAGHYPGLVEQVLDLVRRNDALSYTVISSFDLPSVERARALVPGLATYGILAAACFAGLSAAGKGPREAVDELACRGFTWVAVEKSYLTALLVGGFHRAGLQVGAWLVNDAEELATFAGMGVDYVTSDRPDLLLACRARR